MSTTIGSGLPPQALTVINQFLVQNGFTGTQRALVKESSKKNITFDSSQTPDVTLQALLSSKPQTKVKANSNRRLSPSSSSSSDSSSGEESSVSGASDSTSSSSSDSSSSSSSDSDSDIESGADTKVAKKAKKLVKRKGTSSSSSSSSSSSDSDADDEQEKPKTTKKTGSTTPAAVLNPRKRKHPDESSKSSSSDSGSSSSSEDERPAKKTKWVPTSLPSSSSSNPGAEKDDQPKTKANQGAPTIPSKVNIESESSDSSSDDSSSSSSSSSSSDDEERKGAPTTNGIGKQPEVPESDVDGRAGSSSSGTVVGDKKSSPEATEGSMHPARKNLMNGKKTHEGARPTPLAAQSARAGDGTHISNAYISYDYADRAYKDLSVTRGKGFTKEKNKKKRGSYRGGTIDMSGGKSFKFED